MRAEISKTTKENKEFVQNVERAKMLEGMESKKAAKRKEDGTKRVYSEKSVKEQKKVGQRSRHFKQTALAPKKKLGDQPDQVKRVLNKIF